MQKKLLAIKVFPQSSPNYQLHYFLSLQVNKTGYHQLSNAFLKKLSSEEAYKERTAMVIERTTEEPHSV